MTLVVVSGERPFKGAIVGLLDELDEAARRRQLDEDAAAQRQAQRDAAYRTTLEPAMQSLHAFLAALIEKLRQLQPKKQQRYTVAGYGDVIGYIEHEYELREERQPSARTITLTFPCAIATTECPHVELSGAPRVKSVLALFQKHRLGGVGATRKDASGDVVSATIRARGRITLGAQFHADAASGQLRVVFANFDELGTVSKLFAPERVNDELQEEIGRYLAREPNTLLREDLSDDYRQQLRTRVHKEDVRRRWEAQITVRRQEELDLLRRTYSLGGRLRGLLPGQRRG